MVHSEGNHRGVVRIEKYDQISFISAKEYSDCSGKGFK